MHKFILLSLISLISLSVFSQANPTKSLSYFDKASKYFDAEKYELSITYCDSAITTDAENLEAYAYRGVCNFFLKKYDTAIQDFDLALILNNGYAIFKKFFVKI